MRSLKHLAIILVPNFIASAVLNALLPTGLAILGCLVFGVLYGFALVGRLQ